MATHTKSASEAITELLSNIQSTMDDKKSSIFVYSSKHKMRILNEFALLFASAFLRTIDDYNLSRNEIRAVLKIIEYMQFGNLLRLSYITIAKDLNIEKANFSRIMKKLKTAKLIIDIDGNLYLNPHIIAKGNFNENNDNDMYILDKSAETLMGTNISPNIETPKMRNNKTLNNNDITK